MNKFETAKESIEEFKEDFGEAHYYFALHAAFPAILTPDILHAIRQSFTFPAADKKIPFPWESVSDVLLSPFCTMVAYGVYEMDLGVRQILLQELKQTDSLGPERMNELGLFLNQQIEQLKYSVAKQDQKVYQAQNWAVRIYREPREVSKELAHLLPATRAEYDNCRKNVQRVKDLSSFFISLADEEFAAAFEDIIYSSEKVIEYIDQPSESYSEFEQVIINEEPVLIPVIPSEKTYTEPPVNVTENATNVPAEKSRTGLEQYAYHIFVSYSQKDNTRIRGRKEGWIDYFVNNLERMLTQSSGLRDIRIFMDKSGISPGENFESSVSEAINQSAMFLCFTSPAYLSSQYCRNELSLFFRKAKVEAFGLTMGDRSRIFNVSLKSSVYQQVPEELQHVAAFPFFEEVNNYEDRMMEKPNFPTFKILEVDSPTFNSKILELSHSIVNTLNTFGRGEANSVKEKLTIYFGEVSDGLNTLQKRTINMLLKQGYLVTTGITAPSDATLHYKYVREKLLQADLSVHLLDEHRGKTITGEAKSYLQKEVEMALQLARACFIWTPAEMNINKIEDDVYLAFIKSLDYGSILGDRTEYTHCIKSEITKEIIDFASHLQNRQEYTKPGGSAAVLIIAHSKDTTAALQLSKMLLEAGVECFINPQEEDPSRNQAALRQRLNSVNSLIFLYGEVSGEWLLERIKATWQFVVSNDYPVSDFFLYMLPPRKNPDDIVLQQRFLQLKVINQSTDPVFSQDDISLKHFVDSLKDIA